MSEKTGKSLRLVVIPTDPISAYEHKGIDWLESYYNPGKMFDEVFAVSPLEKGSRQAYGMTILGVRERHFAAALRDLKPDIIRAYGGYWPSDFACLYRPAGVPVVVSVHDVLPVRPRRSVGCADLVICMSKIVAGTVAGIGVSPERIRILPNRVDLTRFCPVRDESRMLTLASHFPPGKHVLHVGSLYDVKNQDTLIRALKDLPEEYSAVFLGQGDRSRYLELAEELDVSSRCLWIGPVKNSDLPLWYSWCDCMCTPSRREGFGLVFVEAAACGAAIVTSDIAPMNEYLAHGVSAYLVHSYEDPNAIAQAILTVCEDAPYRRRISEGAVAAARRFDSILVDEEEKRIYAEVLRMRPQYISTSTSASIRWGRIFERIGAATPKRLVSRMRTHAGTVRSILVGLSCGCARRMRRSLFEWGVLARICSSVLQYGGDKSHAERALNWLRKAERATGGLRVRSGGRITYPGTSGYLVSALLSHGEVSLAKRVLNWQICRQQADGSCPSPEGMLRVFDTGQVLRDLLAGAGLVPGTEKAARRAMEFLAGQMVDEGRRGFGECHDKPIPETALLYVLPPLIEAARKFNDSRTLAVAEACCDYYCRHDSFLNADNPTHFLGYELEALIDLGKRDLALPVLEQLQTDQAPDGAVARGIGGSPWVCAPGLAQLAICWYKVGRRQVADKAMGWLERHQTLSGGFLGSYGRGAGFFPDVELPSAAEFFLGAHNLRVSSLVDEFSSVVDRNDSRFRVIAGIVKAGDHILECGCGEGHILRLLKEEHADVECIGVTVSTRILEQLPSGIQGRLGPMERLPLPDSSFDLVFSVEAIEHSINKDAAIAEMVRVAKPGGTVVIIGKPKTCWGRFKCPPWKRWPGKEQVVGLLRKQCDKVSVQSICYGGEGVDGSMLVWQGTKRDRLSGSGWNRQLVHYSTQQEVLEHVTHGGLSEWARIMLLNTSAGEKVLEIGGGTGEISLHLAKAGRMVSVVDIDSQSLVFVRSCADKLGLSVATICADANEPLSIADGQFDCVWSSGLLEHFTAIERRAMLNDWARISRKKVIAMVPNASCLAYQTGKRLLEENGEWPYGVESPIVSLRDDFEASGLGVEREFSIGTDHALQFLPKRHPLRRFLMSLQKQVLPESLETWNQGYLLVTIGWVSASSSSPGCV